MDAGAVDWYGGRIWFVWPKNLSNPPARKVKPQTDGRWQLYVNQKPFYIKGAGLILVTRKACRRRRQLLPHLEHGNGRQVLDQAQKNGLYVTLGWMWRVTPRL